MEEELFNIEAVVSPEEAIIEEEVEEVLESKPRLEEMDQKELTEAYKFEENKEEEVK